MVSAILSYRSSLMNRPDSERRHDSGVALLRHYSRYQGMSDTIVQLRGPLCSGQMTTVIWRSVARVNRATMYGSKIEALSSGDCRGLSVHFAETNELPT